MNGNLFVNSQDPRPQILHGVNVVYKKAPFLPITDHFSPQESLSNEDIQYLKKFGFNWVRLGVMWSGLNPDRNVWNMEY